MFEKFIVAAVVLTAVVFLIARVVRICKSGGCDGCCNKGASCSCCANKNGLPDER